jgi:hypothetical protein
MDDPFSQTKDPKVRADRHQKMACEYFELAKSAASPVLRASFQHSAEEYRIRSAASPTTDHPRRVRRGRTAGIAQDHGRHPRLGAPAGQPQASPAGVCRGRHHQHSVRVWRDGSEYLDGQRNQSTHRNWRRRGRGYQPMDSIEANFNDLLDHVFRLESQQAANAAPDRGRSGVSLSFQIEPNHTAAPFGVSVHVQCREGFDEAHPCRSARGHAVS